jgi:hypothetical protein
MMEMTLIHSVRAFSLILLLAASARAESAGALLQPLPPPPVTSAPYAVGEKLTYHFYYGVLMVGRGTFEVQPSEDSKIHVLKVEVKSNSLISAVYPVEDTMVSKFDPVKLRSKEYYQNRREGSYRAWDETFFMYDRSHASMHLYHTGEHRWYEIPAKGVQDKLTTIYYMRMLDWTKIQETMTTLASHKGNHDIRVSKVGAETLKLDDFLEIPCFKVEPDPDYMRGFAKKGKIMVWVSEDKFKVPVKVQCKFSFGTVKAILVGTEGIAGWPYDRD